MKPASDSPRFPWLDLFRLVAAMTVVIVHARGAAIGPFGALPADSKTLPAAAFYLATRVGNEAVVAFFVLSGFFVGGMAVERIIRGDFRVADYAIDRFARIMVPLVPALLLTAFVLYVQGKALNPYQLAGNLLSLQGILVDSYGGNAPLWSLAYETWFYLLAGIIGALAMRQRWSAPLAAALLLTVLVFTRLSPIYLFCWLLGAAAYLHRPRRARPIYALSAALLIIYSIAGIQLHSFPVSISTDIVARARQWIPPIEVGRILLSAGFALLIQQLVLHEPIRVWTRGIDAMGSSGAAFSYSLYLTHYPIIQLAVFAGLPQSSTLDARAFGGFGFLILCCIAAAAVNYWLFERHTGAVRRWLKAALVGRGQRVGAVASGLDP